MAMKLPETLSKLGGKRPLTRARMFAALAVAIAADAGQFFLGPIGWVFLDQAIDVVAMILTMWLLGFHILLLPTFVVELVPALDDLPTWTACVAAVIALRRREVNAASAPPPERQTIDV